MDRPAGSINNEGYRAIGINYKTYYAHILIWIYHRGRIPEGMEVDHKNSIKDDNRLSNLRLATHLQNSMNKKVRANNTSGTTGVIWDSPSRKWRAMITAKGKTHCLGYHKKKRDAIKARKQGEKEHFKEFAPK